MSTQAHDKQVFAQPLLEVRDISKVFQTGGKRVHAVKNTSFAINAGECFGLVGESGSGKSTLARVILQLHRASGGKVFFEGKDLGELKDHQMREMRKQMQIIFQDPLSSLFPHMSVWANITEPLMLHSRMRKAERMAVAERLMELVGLSLDLAYNYPHELSGGQQQRVGIARSLSLKPRLIVCDEPVSALDVSIQAQILKLLQTLRKELGLTYLFIAHNLAVVEAFSDKVGVMYLGKMVEMGPTEDLFEHPFHPYTQALLSAVPKVSVERNRERIMLDGEVPSPLNPPSGCPFHTRCPVAAARCKSEEPVLREIGQGRFVACHLV